MKVYFKITFKVFKNRLLFNSPPQFFIVRFMLFQFGVKTITISQSCIKNFIVCLDKETRTTAAGKFLFQSRKTNVASFI